MPEIFDHSHAPSCSLHPSLDSDQVDWFFFMLNCGMPWGFIQPFSLPLLFPLFFFHWYFSVLRVPICCPFYGGSWMGCAVVPAIAGGGGGGESVYWLTANSENPWILQAPNLRLAMQMLTKLFSKLDVKGIK